MRLHPQSSLRDLVLSFLHQVEVLVENRQRARGTLRRLRHELARVVPELRRRPRGGPRLPSLGQLRLDRLEVADVVEWYEAVQLATSNASAHQSLVSLRNVLYWARRRGLTRWNPAAKLGLQHESQPGDPMSLDELARLRWALDEIEDRLVRRAKAFRDGRAILGASSACQTIRLLELCGGRLNEVAGVRVREVRLVECCILREETKTGPRAIPLGPEAIALLERQLHLLGGRFEHVFPSLLRPVAPVGTSTVEYTFREACVVGGLRRRSPHDLRHSFAYHALRAGVSIEALAAAFGHEDTRTTKKVYGRHNVLTPESVRVARTVEESRRNNVVALRKEVADVAA